MPSAPPKTDFGHNQTSYNIYDFLGKRFFQSPEMIISSLVKLPVSGLPQRWGQTEPRANRFNYGDYLNGEVESFGFGESVVGGR